MSYLPRDSKLSSTRIKLDKSDKKGIEVKIYKFSGGSEEDLLTFLHEFEEAVKSEDMLTEEYSTKIYHTFKQVIRGPAANWWECILQSRRKKLLTKFEKEIGELTGAMLLKDPVERQIKYLQMTKKPKQLTMQEWVEQIETINEYLPRMDPEQTKLTNKQIIHQILLENIPV